MRRVRMLPASVAEKIAAGEVIERPSSVVKELVENSLDAGATEITVQLAAGGKGLIEVLDNGSGLHVEDLALSLQRHATSKLASLEDLERIVTLGFRGEALPSIAAVSELSLLSRAPGAPSAHELRPGSARPEPVTFGHFHGAAHGTRVRASGLFSQIPARLKFLKSQGAEVTQVREWLERLALARPEVGFRLTSDDRSLLNLRPADETSRVREILSDGQDFPVIRGESPPEDVAFFGCRVRAYWLQGLSLPGSRRLVQIVNGRAVRDRMLQQAALAAFRQALLPGQFPAVAVFVEIDPAQIDVNVHPTKTELRFLDSRKVFRAIESVFTRMIETAGAPAYAPQPAHASNWTAHLAAPNFGEPSRPGLWRSAEPTDAALAPRPRANPLPEAPALHPFQRARFVGSVFNTYLVYDFGEELRLIDQHAAHERVRYEALRARALDAGAAPSSQALLIPEAAKFAPEARPTLEARLNLLTQLGFEAEVFGEDTVLFRAVPADWGTDSLRQRLKGLVDRLLELDSHRAAPLDVAALKLDETLFESLASEACHSAVRAGDRLETSQAIELVDRLFACRHPWNCPHGRPTVAHVPRARFEEWFQRS